MAVLLVEPSLIVCEVELKVAAEVDLGAGGGSTWLRYGRSGQAISITPTNDIKPQICCVLLNLSWSKSEQAQLVIIGTRKVITVASAIGRY